MPLLLTDSEKIPMAVWSPYYSFVRYTKSSFFYATCRSAISWDVPVLNQCTSDKKILIFSYISLVSLCLFSMPSLLKLALSNSALMETRYKETNLLWPHFTKHEMKFCQVLS